MNRQPEANTNTDRPAYVDNLVWECGRAGMEPRHLHAAMHFLSGDAAPQTADEWEHLPLDTYLAMAAKVLGVRDGADLMDRGHRARRIAQDNGRAGVNTFEDGPGPHELLSELLGGPLARQAYDALLTVHRRGEAIHKGE